jgi:two-component system, cell cycle response regulator DivK
MTLPNLINKTVLVVEDDDMSFLYLNQLFLLTKCKLIHARSGSEAMELFAAEKPDMVLMDIQLPDMEGTEVTRKIRQTGSEVPIIAQTAGKSGEEQDRALKAGCSAVLIKPFTMEKLFGLLLQYS